MTPSRIALTLTFGLSLLAALPAQIVPRLPKIGPLPAPGTPAPAPTPAPATDQQQAPQQQQEVAPQPAAATAPQTALPAWMQEGMRVTYYSGSATLNGVRTQLVPGDDGSWVDSQGRRYREQDVSNSAGAGYTQYEFAQVAPERIAVNLTTYLFADAGMKAVTLANSQALFGDANGLSDVWLPPAKLRALLTQGTPGVTRIPYPFEGRTLDAVVQESKGASGYMRYMHDLDSGLLLAFSSSTTSDQVLTTNGNTASTAAGATTICTVQLRSMRQLKLPWTGQRAPKWLKEGQRFTYSGSYRNSVTEGNLAPWRFDAQITVQQVGHNGATTLLETRLDYGTGQGQQGSSQRAYGPGSFACLWVDPTTVRGLTAGQVLDRDPVTGWQIAVVGIDGRSVTIAEQGPYDQQRYTWSLENGLMLRSISQQQQGPAVVTYELELVGQ